MTNPPRPNSLLLFNALMVIAGCLVLFVYSLWVIATKSSPLLVLGGPLMLAVPLLIAAMQYRAVFRRSENAARHAGLYLFLAGGALAIFFAAMTFIYAVGGKEIDYRTLAMPGLSMLAALYLMLCGRANQRWADALRSVDMEKTQSEESTADGPPTPPA